jgi:hypothetical protein
MGCKYYTPRAVTQFMVERTNPKLGEIIFDPACGTGGLGPLSAVYSLRRVEIVAPEVADLSALARLPVLREASMDDETDNETNQCNRVELDELRKSLAPWADEFAAPEKIASPSLEIEVVSQETFDYYHSKASFGVKTGECEDGMFKSERGWLQDELLESIEALNLKEGTDKDFFVTRQTPFGRAEGLVLYSLRAYESFREIVTAVQQVLCGARNQWIVYFQGLVSEGPDWEDLPEDARDFTAWIYPDKIVTTKDNAALIREMIG